ncbi:unnamed protein product [Linum trigynum]|uniref:Uncharacterized protein n=1 Tax=Linum trigynum TaxID=586398 RepID=A0AAV2E109_9ROSI
MKFGFQFASAAITALLLVFSSFSPPVSGRFFPNITSLPRDLPLKPNFTTAWESFQNLSSPISRASSTTGPSAKSCSPGAATPT